MQKEKQQLSKEKPNLAFNNKQQFPSFPQISQTDDYIPQLEDEEEKEYQEESEKYRLSIGKMDIGNSVLIQLLNRTDLNQLAHFSLDLTNIISQESTILLTNLLSQLTIIQKLDLNLQQNEINNTQIKELFLTFQAMKQLRSLKLNITEISFKEGNQQFPSINLLTFNFRTEIISGFQTIYQALGAFPQLQELELIIGRNNQSKIEMIALTKSFFNLQLLTSLILKVNHVIIESSGIETLTTAISKLILLETLELSLIRCRLKISHTACIFVSVHPLVNLKHLTIVLDTNELAKKQLHIMTKKFRNFKHLHTINFELEALSFFQEDGFQLNGLEYEREHFNGVFEELIRQSCFKNAKHLVNYQKRDSNSMEF